MPEPMNPRANSVEASDPATGLSAPAACAALVMSVPLRVPRVAAVAGVNPWSPTPGYWMEDHPGERVPGGTAQSSKRYPAEFKRDAVELVRSSPERTVAEIAAELGVSDQGLRKWVDQARIDAVGDRGGALTTAEREERVCKAIGVTRL
jgi:hypothetical protein